MIVFLLSDSIIYTFRVEINLHGFVTATVFNGNLFSRRFLSLLLRRFRLVFEGSLIRGAVTANTAIATDTSSPVAVIVVMMMVMMIVMRGG